MKLRLSLCHPIAITVLMAVAFSVSSTAFGQLNSTGASVSISATLGEIAHCFCYICRIDLYPSAGNQVFGLWHQLSLRQPGPSVQAVPR
jgi:hypothetical protein